MLDQGLSFAYKGTRGDKLKSCSRRLGRRDARPVHWVRAHSVSTRKWVSDRGCARHSAIAIDGEVVAYDSFGMCDGPRLHHGS